MGDFVTVNVNDKNMLVLLDQNNFHDKDVIRRFIIKTIFFPEEISTFTKDHFDSINALTFVGDSDLNKELNIISQIEVEWKTEEKKINFIRILKSKNNPPYMV